MDVRATPGDAHGLFDRMRSAGRRRTGTLTDASRHKVSRLLAGDPKLTTAEVRLQLTGSQQSLIDSDHFHGFATILE